MLYKKPYQPIFQETIEEMKKIVDKKSENHYFEFRTNFGERKMNEMNTNYKKKRSKEGISYYEIPKEDQEKLIKKYDLDVRDIMPNLDGFSEAVYNDNTIAEIVDALDDGPDQTDMEVWGITASEWTSALKDALAYRIYMTREFGENDYQ